MTHNLIKTGIFGGTFDPIHQGHLIIAETMLDAAGLDRMIFVPSYNTPLKEETELTAAHLRFEMVARAIRSNKRFEISDFEFQQRKKIYTIETLNYFAKRYPEEQLYFIIGEDSYRNFSRWHHYHEILTKYRVICARREYDNSVAGYENSSKIQVYKTPNIQISSTMIRNRVLNGLSIKYLVPAEVEAAIHHHKLYL